MIQDGALRFHNDLEPLLDGIDSVQQHPENFNNGDLEAIEESIMVNGMYRPIYVQESTGYIIAGNHTWEACKSLGAQRVPVVRLDVDDEEALRVMIADNQTASLAQPDNAQLMVLLDRLAATETDLQGTGMTHKDLETLHHLNEIPLETDEFGQWPTIVLQVPPHVRKAFYDMTEAAAGDDRSRFELLLRLAGWEP